MTTLDVAPEAEPPPIPSVPTSGPKREGTLRAYAERIVQKLGPAAALLLACELDEAAEDAAQKAVP